jgi:hypothetical protein
MRHIADHYRRLERYEHTGPDFFVIEYMRTKGIISSEDYKWATRCSTRQDCDGLVDFAHKTLDMKRKEARALEERPNGGGLVDFGYKPPEIWEKDNRMDGQMEEVVSLELDDRLRRRALSRRFRSRLNSGAKTVGAKIIANVDHSHGNSGTSTIGKCKASRNPGDAESEDQNYPIRRSRGSKASGGQCSRCMLQGIVVSRLYYYETRLEH